MCQDKLKEFRCLRDGESALFIIGPKGSGKTTRSIEIAHKTLSVLVVADGSSLRNARLLMKKIGLDVPVETCDTINKYCLGRGRVTVVLDVSGRSCVFEKSIRVQVMAEAYDEI